MEAPSCVRRKTETAPETLLLADGAECGAGLLTAGEYSRP